MLFLPKQKEKPISATKGLWKKYSRKEFDPLMKFRKILSELLFGVGCAISFVALLAVILPEINHPQLQLVLSSFRMSSDHPAVQAINDFMLFALQQNWRLLYMGLMVLGVGAALLLHFTPKQRKEPDQPDPLPAPAQAEKANPYASVCYQKANPEPRPDNQASFLIHAEPILERNQIGENEPLFVSDIQPYFSPRLKAESRAIETDIGLQSQSGSRVLIRNVFETAEETAPLPEKKSIPSLPPSPSSAPFPASASRIRSTMGRHSTGSSNLPLHHP